METQFCESDCIGSAGLGPVEHFVFGRRDVTDRFEQSPVVEPVDPFQGGELDVVDVLPRSPSADHFGLVEPVDGFRERVVVGIALRSDRGDRSGLGETFGVADGEVLGGFKGSSQPLSRSRTRGTFTGTFWSRRNTDPPWRPHRAYPGRPAFRLYRGPARRSTSRISSSSTCISPSGINVWISSTFASISISEIFFRGTLRFGLIRFPIRSTVFMKRLHSCGEWEACRPSLFLHTKDRFVNFLPALRLLTYNPPFFIVNSFRSGFLSKSAIGSRCNFSKCGALATIPRFKGGTGDETEVISSSACRGIP